MADDLLEVRQQFINLSGRFDLATTSVTTHDTDNGANYFINAGMRFLDRRFTHHKSEGNIYEQVAADAYYITFQNCISVREVWATDDANRWRLTKYTLKKMQQSYGTLRSSITTGMPLYWAPISIRPVDVTDFESLGAFLDYVKTTDDGTYTGILFAPPADHAYNIKITGKFYTPEMTSNTDSNFWTKHAIDTLVKAALYQLEVHYRNTEGARDWLNAINIEGSDLEKDLVEHESEDMEVIEYE